MEKPWRIILVGNYRPDKQRSMLRFSALLEKELAARNWTTQMLHPPEFAGRISARVSRGPGKWLAYFDKYCIFPLLLRRAAARAPAGSLFHICDHSNAPYAAHLGKRPVVVTVHDLLAVRGGLGDASAMCPASRAGALLQRHILARLRKIPWVACDSEATRGDFFRLTQRSDADCARTIPLAADPDFRMMDSSAALEVLRTTAPGILDRPFLLHVGSSQPRKNRETCIDLMGHLRDEQWDGRLVFAGDPMTPTQESRARAEGVRDRIVEIAGPSDESLRALYCRAHALVFPSYAEGFGWPVLEAQACGCPAICSNRTSLPEVAGAAGLVLDPDDTAGFAAAVLRLEDPLFRRTVREAGLKNVAGFSIERMIHSYVELYQSAMTARDRPA